MKASEIVEKFKNVLLNADEEQVQPEVEVKEESDIEVQEEVVLSEQKEEVKESEDKVELSEEVEAGYGYGDKDDKKMEEMPKPKESDFVTKEELAKAIAEVKAMVAKLSQEEALEVPEELQAEEKQELSAQEPAVEPITHNPESEVGKKPEYLYSQKKRMNTRDIVFNKIANF